jgi:hypothetical protein
MASPISLDTKLKINAAEIARRREAVQWADAHNRIEGQFPSPESEKIFEAFICGDIEQSEILPRLRALHRQP